MSESLSVREMDPQLVLLRALLMAKEWALPLEIPRVWPTA